MTITKERLLKIQHWRETYGADSNVMLPAEEAAELARIVLASLTAEPVFYIEVEGDDWTQAGRIPGSTFDFNNLPDGINQLYATPPAPVADADPVVFTDERNLHHIARGRETSLIWGKQNQEVGDIPLYRHAQPAPVVHQIMRELVSLLDEDQFARIENIALSAGVMPPQPVPVVPEKCPAKIRELMVSHSDALFNDGDAQEIWNACRAAMLQGAEPVSQTYELPELIEGMEVSVDVSTCDFDAGHRYFGTVTEVSELDTAKNGYILLVQDAKPNFDVNGNSPVIPDGWISCSERMPDNDESKPIAIFTGKCLGQGMFVATYDDDGFFDYWEGMEIIGVTHWMPLPEPPQK